MECSMLTCACLLLVIQTLLVSTSSTGLKPGRFRKETSRTTSEVKNAEENTWLNFTFSIRHSPNWTSFTLYKRNAAQCTFRNNKSLCNVSKNISICSCGSREGEYLFAKRVNRSDNSLWIWREFTNITVTGNGTITINISLKRFPPREISCDSKCCRRLKTFTAPAHLPDPTIVTNLTVQGYTYREDDFYVVAINSSAQVVCTWITGNPPTAVHLKDENGTLMYGEPNAEILRHNISTRRCNSLVNVVCKSINSDGNTSVKILTECFPELIDHSKRIRQSAQEKPVVLEFEMYSYAHITQCHIIHYKDENSFNAMIYECKKTQGNYSEPYFEKCWCTTIGRTPNRSVTIYIVSEDDNGLWQVNVSTSLGSVHFNFSLPVLKEISTSTYFILQVGVSMGAGALSFTVIIICIIVVIKKRKKNLIRTQAYLGETD